MLRRNQGTRRAVSREAPSLGRLTGAFEQLEGTLLDWALVSHVPDAVAHGAEVRAHSMAAHIEIDRERHMSGVHYFDREGAAHFWRTRAVLVCGYAIETPRLLLNSSCPEFSTGLANSSGTLGRYLMAQAGNVVLGRFADLVRMYRASPAHAMTEEFYETDRSRGFARGFAIQTVDRCRSRSPSRSSPRRAFGGGGSARQ